MATRNLLTFEWLKIKRQIGRRFAIVRLEDLHVIAAYDTREEAFDFIDSYERDGGKVEWWVADAERFTLDRRS